MCASACSVCGRQRAPSPAKRRLAMLIRVLPLARWIWDTKPAALAAGVFSLLAVLAPAHAFAQSPSYGYGTEDQAPGAQPSYPGIPPSGDKVETDIGNVKVRLYGTVLLNTSVSDSSVIGQDVPLWTGGGNVTYPDGSVGRGADNHDL